LNDPWRFVKEISTKLADEFRSIVGENWFLATPEDLATYSYDGFLPEFKPDAVIIPGNTVRFTAKPDIGTLQPGTYSAVSRVLLEDGRVLDEKTTSFEVTQPYVSPVTEASITLSPGSPGTLVSGGGRYSVVFPQGSVLGQVTVTIRGQTYTQEEMTKIGNVQWPCCATGGI
jgi:hypothetical protein